jgi:DNA mismatch endonuclease (patch repair protein)
LAAVAWTLLLQDGVMSGPVRMVSLGGGRRVPYPEPTSASATNVGRGNARVDTRPEIALRSALHRRGLRFRKDYLVRGEGRRVKPDIVFTRWKVAVFVDGCFWHGCPEHGRVPKRNRDYWIPKLERNKDRDRETTEWLTREGWLVVRLWEHVPLEAMVGAVVRAVVERSRR